MRVPVFSVLISSLISNITITLKFNVVGLMILHYNNTTCTALVGLTQKDNSIGVELRKSGNALALDRVHFFHTSPTQCLVF